MGKAERYLITLEIRRLCSVKLGNIDLVEEKANVLHKELVNFCPTLRDNRTDSVLS